LGPTMPAIGEVNTSSVFLPNDLNPASSMDFRYIPFRNRKQRFPNRLAHYNLDHHNSLHDNMQYVLVFRGF